MGTIKSHNIFTTLFCVVMDLNVIFLLIISWRLNLLWKYYEILTFYYDWNRKILPIFIPPINIRISIKDYKEINLITSFIIDKRLHGDIFEL